MLMFFIMIFYLLFPKNGSQLAIKKNFEIFFHSCKLRYTLNILEHLEHFSFSQKENCFLNWNNLICKHLNLASCCRNRIYCIFIKLYPKFAIHRKH